MKITENLSDAVLLVELGRRIAQYRLNRNLTQAELALEAGVSQRTLTRCEHGESVQAASLIRILRALQMLENFEMLIPEPAPSPLQQLKRQGKQRQRASSKSTIPKPKTPFVWGDDQ